MYKAGYIDRSKGGGANRFAKSMANFEKSVELEPNNPWKLVNIAIVLNNEMADFTAAEGYAQRAKDVKEFQMAEIQLAFARYQQVGAAMHSMNRTELEAALGKIDSVIGIPFARFMQVATRWPIAHERLKKNQGRLNGIQPVSTFPPVFQGSADDSSQVEFLYQGFEPIQNLQLEIDGAIVEGAGLYQLDGDKFLIVDPSLKAGLLIRSGSWAERISIESVRKNTNGLVDVTADAQPVHVARFYLTSRGGGVGRELLFEGRRLEMGPKRSTVPAPPTVPVAGAPKRYPWDKRPVHCGLAEDDADLQCQAQLWVSYTDSRGHLMALLNAGDFELIGRAEKDLAYSDQRFEDGEYRAAFWWRVTQRFFDAGGATERISSKWEEKLGTDSFACYAKAMFAMGPAKRARGSRYINTVPVRVMEQHYDTLDKADALLNSCPEKVKHTLPWHSAKLEITYRSPRLSDRRQAQLAAAVADWPDAIQTYRAAMTYSQPKWGGTFRELERLARMAESASKSTMRSAMYSRVYSEVLWDGSSYSLDEGEADWDDLKSSFRDVEALEQFPISLPTQFAKMACAMADRDEARYQFELGQRVAKNHSRPATLDQTDACVGFAFAED